MKKEMDSGHYCYVVYPLIEESDKMDLKDAKSGFESLQKVFKNYKLGFMHGKLDKVLYVILGGLGAVIATLIGLLG